MRNPSIGMRSPSYIHLFPQNHEIVYLTKSCLLLSLFKKKKATKTNKLLFCPQNFIPYFESSVRLHIRLDNA